MTLIRASTIFIAVFLANAIVAFIFRPVNKRIFARHCDGAYKLTEFQSYRLECWAMLYFDPIIPTIIILSMVLVVLGYNEWV